VITKLNDDNYMPKMSKIQCYQLLASKLLKPSWHLEYVFLLLLALEWNQMFSEP